MANFNSKRFHELWPMERDIKTEIQKLRDEISNQEQQLSRSESGVRGQASQYQTEQFEIYKKKEQAILELKRDKLRELWARQKEIDDEIAPLRVLFYKAEKLKEQREEEDKQRKSQNERAVAWAADVARSKARANTLRERGVNSRGRPLPYHLLPKHLQVRQNNLEAQRRIYKEKLLEEQRNREAKIQERMSQLRLKKSFKNNNKMAQHSAANEGLQQIKDAFHSFKWNQPYDNSTESRKSWQANWSSPNPVRPKNSLKNNSKKAEGPLRNTNLMGGRRTRKLNRKNSSRKTNRK